MWSPWLLSVSSQEPRLVVTLSSFVMILILTLLAQFNPSSLSSTGFLELGPVLVYGSPQLLPQVIG